MDKQLKKYLREDEDMPEAPEKETVKADKVSMALICAALRSMGYKTEYDEDDITVQGYDGVIYKMMLESCTDLKDGDKLYQFSCEGKSAAAIVSDKESKANISDITDMLSEIAQDKYKKDSFGAAMESVDKYGFPLFEAVGDPTPMKAGSALEKPKTTAGTEYDEKELSDGEVKPADIKKDVAPKSMEGDTAKVDKTEKDLAAAKVKLTDISKNAAPKLMGEDAKKKFKEKMMKRFAENKKAKLEDKKDEKEESDIHELSEILSTLEVGSPEWKEIFKKISEIMPVETAEVKEEAVVTEAAIKWQSAGDSVPGLLTYANVGNHYQLQVYKTKGSNNFNSGFYGPSAEGKYELMDTKLTRDEESAKKHAEEEFAKFKKESPLFDKYEKENSKKESVQGASNVNPDEKKMIAHLSGSQVSQLARLSGDKEKQIQLLGEIFSEEVMEKLGIDPGAEWKFEDIIAHLESKKPEFYKSKKVAESLESGNEGHMEAGNALEKAKTTVGKEYDEKELSDLFLKSDDISKDKDPETMEAGGKSKGDGEKTYPTAKIKTTDISKDVDPKVMGESRKEKHLAEMRERIKAKRAK